MPKQRVRSKISSALVEVDGHADRVLLTVSKERYEEDAVQIVLDRHVARALAHLLLSMTD